MFNLQDKSAYNDDDFGDSDNEAEPDAYLARVKAEGQERESDDDGGDSDESTDDDFNPDAEKVEDVADEYDSNVETTSDSDADSDDSGRDKKKKEKKKKEKKKDHKEKSGSVSAIYSIALGQLTKLIFLHLFVVKVQKEEQR